MWELVLPSCPCHTRAPGPQQGAFNAQIWRVILSIDNNSHLLFFLGLYCILFLLLYWLYCILYALNFGLDIQKWIYWLDLNFWYRWRYCVSHRNDSIQKERHKDWLIKTAKQMVSLSWMKRGEKMKTIFLFDGQSVVTPVHTTSAQLTLGLTLGSRFTLNLPKTICLAHRSPIPLQKKKKKLSPILFAINMGWD